ncbi:MAG TPA: hypothetical protein VF456_09980 [Vicinamibacterales bacterium]
MRHTIRTLIVAVVLLGLPIKVPTVPLSPALSAQTREVMSEARVRDFVRQAAREAKNDPTETILDLDRRVRDRWGDFESFPLSIMRNDDLLVAVTAPYLSFRNSLVDMLRSGRSISQAVWTNLVTVTITPRRLGAPDIDAVGVTRNNQTVAPTRNALRPMRFSNGTGEEGVLHAGDVGFTPTAFAPGGAVVITLTRHDADSIVHVFSDDELNTLK